MDNSIELGKINNFLSLKELCKDYIIQEMFQQTWQLSINNNVMIKRILKIKIKH